MKRALVLSLVCVLGLTFVGFAATLSGTWDTDITIDPQQTNFNDAISLFSQIDVIYTVGDWSFTSQTYLDEDGWSGQFFDAAGVLGAFTIASAVYFLPNAPYFSFWHVEVGVSIAGVSFDLNFALQDNDVGLALEASGVAGDVTIDAYVVFGDPGDDVCDLNWTEFGIELGLPFCCAEVELFMGFNCDGFSTFLFRTEGLAIPNLPWLTIDTELRFDLDAGKSLILSPTFDFGDIACFELDISVDVSTNLNDPLILDGISIDGISLECDIGAVTFTGETILGGIPDYFEIYTISTSADACCGPFSFDLTFSFREGGLRLFDLGLIEANMELQVSSQFTFNMGLGINVETGTFAEWTLGFEVAW